MTFVRHGDVRIHYRTEGAGRPLVLLHGLLGSSETFSESGWSAALRDHYRLILIDARGHGMSDKPHEPEAYRMELQVADVTTVLDDLGVQRSHCLGYSMGGDICFGIAKYAPERALSLVIGGADARDPDPEHPSEGSQRMIQAIRGGREAIASAYRRQTEEEIKSAQMPSVVEAWVNQRLLHLAEWDPEALVALLMLWQRECLRIPEVLPHLAIPCFFFIGEADSALRGAKAAAVLTPNARFVSFPGLGHTETAARSDLVIPPILQFLSEVDSTL